MYYAIRADLIRVLCHVLLDCRHVGDQAHDLVYDLEHADPDSVCEINAALDLIRLHAPRYDPMPEIAEVLP